MNKSCEKYIPFEPIPLSDRTWPDKRITAAPVWCSVDLRDGNQALIDPVSVTEKLELFHTLVDIGVKEIEVGFPSASETEYEFLRALIDGGHIPDDVTIQVLVQAREHLIKKTFEAIEGAKHVIFHFYNSTSTLQRKVVFHTDMAGVTKIAVDAAKLIRELSQPAIAAGMDLRYEYSPESFMGTEMDAAAEICAAVLDALQGRDPRDGTSLDGQYGHLLEGLTGDIRGMKVGLPVDCYGDGLDGQVKAAVLKVSDVLKGRGAEVIELSFPVMEYVVPAYYIIAAAEASSNLSRFDGVKYGWRAEQYDGLADLYRKTRTQGFGAEVKRRILLGTFVLSSGYYDAYYKKALQVKAVIKDAFDRAFERCDLLLTPVAPATAPKLGESLSDPLQMYLSDVYTVSVNLAGLPGLSMPCGFDSGGLPIGAQLIGPHFGEGKLLNAAHAFQLDTDFHKRMPKGGERA